MIAKELSYFVLFFFGSLLVWAFSRGQGIDAIPDMLDDLLVFDVTTVMVALGPYLAFQLLRVLIGGLSRKV